MDALKELVAWVLGIIIFLGGMIILTMGWYTPEGFFNLLRSIGW